MCAQQGSVTPQRSGVRSQAPPHRFRDACAHSALPPLLSSTVPLSRELTLTAVPLPDEMAPAEWLEGWQRRVQGM